MTPRVSFVITDSGVGGSEKVLDILLNDIDRRRVQVSGVIVLKKKREMAERWEKHGVPVAALGMGRWPSPLTLLALRRELKRQSPDVVHAFLFHSIQLARLIKGCGGKYQLISSPRVNYRFAGRAAIALDRMLKRFDTLSVTESDAGRRALIDGLGYSALKVRVARNSVDAAVYRPDAAVRSAVRREWGIAESETLVGAVGRLHAQKGFDVLIEALAKMRGIARPFRAVLVGDGPQRSALEALAKSRGVPIQFAGQRADMPRLLPAIDIYVQSSRYEGLSNALLEAMSAGCACVATAVDGTMDFAKDGQNMLLVKPEDPVTLAAAIGYLIENPRKQKEISENAKMTAQEMSPEMMVASFEQAYLDAMDL